MPSRQATILALALNEIVSNVFKHSFAGRKEGRLLVGAAQHGDNITLSVADDGPGLPEGFDPETAEGLGLSLVRTLVRADLKGTFILHRAPLPPELWESWRAAQKKASHEEGDEDQQHNQQWTIAEIQFAASSLPQTSQ